MTKQNTWQDLHEEAKARGPRPLLTTPPTQLQLATLAGIAKMVDDWHPHAASLGIVWTVYNRRTVDGLERRGLIVCARVDDGGWGIAVFDVTPAGRAYLATL